MQIKDSMRSNKIASSWAKNEHRLIVARDRDKRGKGERSSLIVLNITFPAPLNPLLKFAQAEDS